MPTSDNRITPKQRRTLQMQRAQLGIDDDTYRATIAQYPCVTAPPDDSDTWPALNTPCHSSKQLSRAQASLIITRWVIAGAPVGGPYSGSRTKAQRNTHMDVVTLPSPAQRAKIARLIPEIPWRKADGYSRWLSTRMNLDPIHAPRTFYEAEAIIAGLRQMRDRYARNAA